MVFQWPWGIEPTNRSPRGQRPRSLTKLVLVAVASMNTNLAGSRRPCLRIQRRRARATSARSCSVARRLFFDGDIMSLENSPVGGCHGSIDEPDAATAKQSQAKVGVLHHGKCLVAASDGKEIRTAKE